MPVRIPSPQDTLRSRRCADCGETKPWRDFPARTLWPDGQVRTVLSYCRTCQPARNIDYQDRNREAVRAQRREYMRQRTAQLRRERTPNGNAGGHLPVGPLREFLQGELRDRSLEQLSWASGVDERVIRRLLSEAKVVGLVQADRLVTRLGGVFELVYPLDGEQAA